MGGHGSVVAACPMCGRQRWVSAGDTDRLCHNCVGLVVWFDIPPPGEWVAEALCTQTDPDAFFPSKNDHRRRRSAQSICLACPVRLQCLDYALQIDTPHGIWGGLTPKERHQLRKDSA